MKKNFKNFIYWLSLFVLVISSVCFVACKEEEKQFYIGDTLIHKGLAITLAHVEETDIDWLDGVYFSSERIVCVLEIKNNSKYTLRFNYSDLYLLDQNGVKLYSTHANLLDEDENEIEFIVSYEKAYMFIYFAPNEIFKNQELKFVYIYADYDTENYVEYISFEWNLAEKPVGEIE